MAIEIADINKLIHQDCKKVIIGVLKNRNIGFEKIRARPQRDVFWLNGNTIARASTNERVYHVVPFLALDDAGLTYWLAIGISFDIVKGIHKFHDASLSVFEGMSQNENKTPILRAEWGLSIDGLHAQPHWHVYPSYINKVIVPFIDATKLEMTEFRPDQVMNIENDSNQQEDNNLPKFHFAMGSFWHLNGEGAHVVECSEKGLVNWLKGCLEYIKIQLRHMAG